MGLKYHAFFCCCTLFGSYPMSVVFILSYWKLPWRSFFVHQSQTGVFEWWKKWGKDVIYLKKRIFMVVNILRMLYNNMNYVMKTDIGRFDIYGNEIY